jgi:hypothetical protein
LRRGEPVIAARFLEEAVLSLNQTLILTGLSQRESRKIKSGVPGLRSIPIIKYLFSETSTTVSDLAIIILLTPRDPAYWDERNKQEPGFVEKRRLMSGPPRAPRRPAALQGTVPGLGQTRPQPPRFHFFLMEISDAYRRVSGIDLATKTSISALGAPPKRRRNERGL